jgi:hypothetical protein
MSSKKRRSSIEGQWAAVTIEMLESPAYRALSLSGHRILARIQIELANHGGKDNGRLPVTYDNFQAYGVDRHAIGPALREVEALGFIETTERGRAGNAEWRKPSHYRLTFRGPAGDYNGTHEWRRISESEAKYLARDARRSKAKKSAGQCGKKPVFGVEVPHQNRIGLGGEILTTAHGGVNDTTIDIPGVSAAKLGDECDITGDQKQSKK